jgi:hypothetical protein
VRLPLTKKNVGIDRAQRRSHTRQRGRQACDRELGIFKVGGCKSRFPWTTRKEPGSQDPTHNIQTNSGRS